MQISGIRTKSALAKMLWLAPIASLHFRQLVICANPLKLPATEVEPLRVVCSNVLDAQRGNKMAVEEGRRGLIESFIRR